MPRYQWHATVKSLFFLCSPMLVTSYVLRPLLAPHCNNPQDLFVLLCHFTCSWYSWKPWELYMASPGRAAAAPADPGTHLQLQLPQLFLHALACAQNILCKAVCCSVLSCFFHTDPVLFQASKKIARGKKFTAILKIFFFCLCPAMQGLC